MLKNDLQIYMIACKYDQSCHQMSHLAVLQHFGVSASLFDGGPHDRDPTGRYLVLYSGNFPPDPDTRVNGKIIMSCPIYLVKSCFELR